MRRAGGGCEGCSIATSAGAAMGMYGGCRAGVTALGPCRGRRVTVMGHVTHLRPHIGPKPEFPVGTPGLQSPFLLLKSCNAKGRGPGVSLSWV